MSFGPKTGYRDGGNRGGHDRFKWEDVKEEKYREHYLGHSVKAPTGRWQKGKDLFWYNKAGSRLAGSDAEEARRRELEEIRRRDEDMINEALGLAPKRHAVVETQLEPAELKALLAKGASERDRLDVERVEGLGAAPAARHEHLGPAKSFVEREIERMKQAQAEGGDFQYQDGALHEHEEGHGSGDDDEEEGAGGEGGGGGRGDKERRKKEKKAAKKRKKEEKKAKKAEKKRLKKEGKDKDKKDSGSGSDDDDSRSGKRRRRLSPSRSRSRERGGGGGRDRDRDLGRARDREARGRSRSRSCSRSGPRRRRSRSRSR